VSKQATLAVHFAFVPKDAWVGLYVDRPNRRVYIAFLPCLVLKVSW
jgi:hypothetical protein